MKKTQGALAVQSGREVEGLVASILNVANYNHIHFCPTIEALNMAKIGLFEERGCYAKQCDVPLVSPCHRGKNRATKVDFVIRNRNGDIVLLSIKAQFSDGTAGQKLEFEIRQLMMTELPAAILVFGPMKGRDGPEGWTPKVLEPIWERATFDGAGRIFLFRNTDKLGAWLQAGLPIGSRGGITSASIFAQFCDREP